METEREENMTLNQVAVTGQAAAAGSDRRGLKVVRSCQQKILKSIRGLFDLSHSVLVSIWAFLLITSRMNDVESHAFLLLSSLGYHSYSTYWLLREFLDSKKRDQLENNSNNSSWIRLIHSCLSLAIVVFSIRAISIEMAGWRNTVVPLMMDMHPSSGWNQPTNVQRKALSHHLLAKSSDIAWLLTLNLLVHELPGIFLHTIRLMKISDPTDGQIKEESWTNDVFQSEPASSAASIGAAAWRRERGLKISDNKKKRNSVAEKTLSILHRVSFALIQVLGGFIVIHLVLVKESLVRDTCYVASALLLHGMTLYLFGGIISYTTKANSAGAARGRTKRSLSYQLATSVNDSWLR
ncbi:unnamed protein product [Clavelina lepadiformis]|uniref:Uncharacterized protein n=1 Tax=Clavelina lepadiformis TaxID=159417 RepID=A0ABP0EUU0_CLALP